MDGRTEIFVFGSNLSGIHGAGAALFAKKNHGAKQGNGHGIQGKSYALPTKDKNIKTLPIEEVAKYVEVFKKYATKHPEYVFYVTAIGCGLAGFTAKEIAPMFSGSPVNCEFTVQFKPYLGDTYTYRKDP